MKKLRITLISLVVFILMTVIVVNMLLNGSKILKNFDIISFTNVDSKYVLKFERVPAAVKYKVEIIDEDGIKVYDNTTGKTSNDIELTNLEYNKEYSLMVYAYDAIGDYRPANKEYTFTWDEANIEDDASILLNNEDYKLHINGNLKKEKYKLRIEKDGKIIEEKILKDNDYIISSSYYKDSPTELLVSIIHNNKVIDSIKLYNKKNPISNIGVVSPKENSIVPIDDISLIMNGGENATSFLVQIYDGKNLIKESTTTKKHVIISKKLFEISKTYKIKVRAMYDNFSKETEVNFTMSDQEQLKPVYISNNWKHIKKGSKIVLSSPDKDATIYYTLNGENPESFGTQYKEPIVINNNVTLKTVAVSDKKHNSIIRTYDINITPKKDFIVYLSPSNQHGNMGVSETGYTNERDEMNDLTDYIAERLKSYGVKVYRNNSSGNINLWLRDSNYLGADLHLAIHSNASIDHTSYGVETWIHADNSNTYSLANIIQNNLVSIYPYKNLTGHNRGVKYANGALGEVNDNYLPFGILIEIAHHDYHDDALWIMQNKKLIGYNIADSILKYYQIIE